MIKRNCEKEPKNNSKVENAIETKMQIDGLKSRFEMSEESVNLKTYQYKSPNLKSRQKKRSKGN